MLNLVVEKGTSKDRDWSGLSITRPRTGDGYSVAYEPITLSCILFIEMKFFIAILV